jgi:hypothetical protein
MDDPNEPDVWPPPRDLISKEDWDGFMTLPTDVVLKTTSYEGSWASRVHRLASDWIGACPMDPQAAPFMHAPALIAFEEFDAAVFNAIHGYYRQAFNCMRNALETLAIAAGFAVTRNAVEFDEWRNGEEIFIGKARRFLENSSNGRRIDRTVTLPIFGEDKSNHWLIRQYDQLGDYTHGNPGHTNMDLWRSNGPIFVPAVLRSVEDELRETLALAYLLLKLGWNSYQRTEGIAKLLSGSTTGWQEYQEFLISELL